MFDYLAPQGDIYSKQYQANKQLYVRTKATYELVLKWPVLSFITIVSFLKWKP